MDRITEDDLASVPAEVVEKAKKLSVVEYNPDEVDNLASSENFTVDGLTQLAARAYHIVSQNIAKEGSEKGQLSDKTRRWFETLTNTLEKLHRAKFGDKSIQVNINKPSFNSIRNFISTGGKVKNDIL